jgi:hypothetical protein
MANAMINERINLARLAVPNRIGNRDPTLSVQTVH